MHEEMSQNIIAASNLPWILKFAPLQVVNGDILQTAGTTRKFCLSGLPGSMTVTLAWHDYPGSPAAAKALVNDLDLTVTVGGSSGQQWRGNGATDRINNVERVSLTFLLE